MKCPYCNNSDTKVIDSRPVEDGLAIRRRRESFDRNKLINGLLKACEKTKITYEDVEKIAERIERALNNTMEKEIESKMIGALIMDELRNLDQVAYVRFASVYHKFTDVNTFVQEVNRLQEKDRVRPEERNEEK